MTRPTRVWASYKPDGVETFAVSVTQPFDYIHPEGIAAAEATVARIMSHMIEEALRLYGAKDDSTTD